MRGARITLDGWTLRLVRRCNPGMAGHLRCLDCDFHQSVIRIGEFAPAHRQEPHAAADGRCIKRHGRGPVALHRGQHQAGSSRGHAPVRAAVTARRDQMALVSSDMGLALPFKNRFVSPVRRNGRIVESLFATGVTGR
ncbi:hypothetical protein [Hankyongella ginsenosidimutans]|uniref:hypothetical protein n=1 Tax=Hankyongella ginsenosidimutans TaxID=1763828 RepID=UPI001CA37703|nr:hypothetical protein [Hankyongella ginsenosidimutans]